MGQALECAHSSFSLYTSEEDFEYVPDFSAYPEEGARLLICDRASFLRCRRGTQSQAPQTPRSDVVGGDSPGNVTSSNYFYRARKPQSGKSNTSCSVACLPFCRVTSQSVFH